MISIAFTGDIMLSRRVKDRLRSDAKFKLLTPEVSCYLRSSDYVVGNLECPLTTSAKKIKPSYFKAHPSSLKQLFDFNLLTIANNHIFDCGKKGAFETSQLLTKNGKDQCGLKLESTESSCFEKSIKGKQFCFVSLTTKSCENDLNPLIYPKTSTAEDRKSIDLVRKKSLKNDFTIAIIHGGNEMIPYPEPSFRDLCKNYIDAGANVVITHHPHVLGCMEKYKTGHIFYSLGDFIFDGLSNFRRQGGILKLNFQENEVNWELKPTNIKNDLSIVLSNYNVSQNVTKKWFKKSQRLLKDDYERMFLFRYIKCLISFQLDRIIFLLKNRGMKTTILFMISKTRLIPFYFMKIIKGNVK